MDYTYHGYNYHIYSDGKSVVVAVASYAGKPVRGIAKCDPLDDFNYEKGALLAAARCAEKIAEKRRTKAYRNWEESVKEFARAKVARDDAVDLLEDADLELETERESIKTMVKDMA